MTRHPGTIADQRRTAGGVTNGFSTVTNEGVAHTVTANFALHAVGC
jgi:hypothetical protein